MQELPNRLRLGLERVLRGVNPAELARSSGDLSARYRAGHGHPGSPARSTQADVLAYLALRLPATYAATAAAMAETAARLIGWSPRSLLDVGCGPGTALWAAAEIWDDLAQATMLDAVPAMVDVGRQLAATGAHIGLRQAGWHQVDLLGDWRVEAHAMVSAAYLLGELPEPARARLIERLWALAGEALILIEPGTPAGWAIIHAAREQLRGAGATIIAPCPHQMACPMPDDDWCHFAQRVGRTQAQRSVKAATLSYEDEKFAYIAVGRLSGSSIGARVLRHPQVRSGHIGLELCAPAGLRRLTVARSDRERWRPARGAEWGGALPEGFVEE